MHGRVEIAWASGPHAMTRASAVKIYVDIYGMHPAGPRRTALFNNSYAVPIVS